MPLPSHAGHTPNYRALWRKKKLSASINTLWSADWHRQNAAPEETGFQCACRRESQGHSWRKAVEATHVPVSQRLGWGSVGNAGNSLRTCWGAGRAWCFLVCCPSICLPAPSGPYSKARVCFFWAALYPIHYLWIWKKEKVKRPPKKHTPRSLKWTSDQSSFSRSLGTSIVLDLSTSRGGRSDFMH